VLLHCHAHCTPAAICAAAGLQLGDLFPETVPRPERTIVATYDYYDERGALLFQVVRFDPKDFRQRRPDGTWSVRGVRRVLFALPALQGQTVVFVVEGEKDVRTLEAIGLTATTNVGGAGKWRAEYVDQLRAAGVQKVIVLPDNDEPGRAHGETVARSCCRGGLHVTVIALPGLLPKGDVSDWLAAGHTREDLLALVHAAPRFVPADAPSPSAEGVSGPRPVIVCLADVQPEPVTWIWPGRLAAGKLAVLIGDPGLGKSWISLDVAARLSRGLPWPDGGSAPAGHVLLLSAEDARLVSMPSGRERPRQGERGLGVQEHPHAGVHRLRQSRSGRHDRGDRRMVRRDAGTSESRHRIRCPQS
jgi:hypothetical protein